MLFNKYDVFRDRKIAPPPTPPPPFLLEDSPQQTPLGVGLG